jgi:exosortase/archaeosortase family protein
MRVLKINKKQKNRLIVEFKGKKYSFSLLSIVLFPIAITILTILLIKLFEMRENFWFHEIITKNSVFLMNLLFNMDAEASYSPENYFPWSIDFPDDRGTYINCGCTYITSISIFTAIILLIPHSKHSCTRQDIIWRKTKSIILSITLIYIFNIFRIAIQNYLYFLGNPWSIVHNSIFTYFIIVMVHILIFIYINFNIPELFLSIYYTSKLTYIHLKKEREKAIKIRIIKKDL